MTVLWSLDHIAPLEVTNRINSGTTLALSESSPLRSLCFNQDLQDASCGTVGSLHFLHKIVWSRRFIRKISHSPFAEMKRCILKLDIDNNRSVRSH